MQQKALLFMKAHRLRHVFFQCTSKLLHNPLVHPGQGALLGCLLDNGSMSQGALYRMLKVSAATVAVSLRRLEQQGLILRQQNPDDLREKLLSLTPLGISVANDMRSAVERVGTLAIQGFSQEELELLDGFLTRISENLQAWKETNEEVSPTDQGE